MKKPGRGTHGHIAIGCNNVDRAIYHLSRRGVKFDLDSKNVKNGKTIACYMADEIGGFAIHLVKVLIPFPYQLSRRGPAPAAGHLKYTHTEKQTVKENTTMKVVTFGELMVRLQPYNYERFVQASTLEFTFGGGEANVAVSLANYGVDAAFVTKLPAHAIGQCAVNSLRRYGVDTSMIVRGGDRVGIYYNEKGASQRGSVCIYDRANSASSWPSPPTSTGIRSSRASTGSTSPASPRLWARTSSRSAVRPARLPRPTASRSAAT